MYSEVRKCEVTECFYNHDKMCSARAITVGSDSPSCETYMSNQQQHTPKWSSALVGACHMGQCVHNRSFFCHAVNDIEVGWTQNDAQCMTFMPK